MLKRLQDQKSHFNVYAWETERQSSIELVKKICEFKGVTMSKRIIEKITEDVNAYNEIGVHIEKKQIKLFLLKTIINKILLNFYNEKFYSISLKNELEKKINNYFSFEVIVGEIKMNDKIMQGEILCKDDNNENWLKLTYSFSNNNNNNNN